MNVGDDREEYFLVFAFFSIGITLDTAIIKRNEWALLYEIDGA
jgi:hypothetical protein